jgi:type I restriction enzyme R subunit
MDMDADIRAWIKATIKAHEEWLASLSDDEKKQLESFDDPAKQLYHSIGRYNSRMTLLQGVIELDAIYSNADFIDFWQRYCFIYRSMLDKQNALGTVKTTYDGELGLLVGEEIEIEEPGEPGGEGGEPKPKPHPGQKRGIANIFEVLAKMNETEAEREQEMQFWFAQIKDLFDFLKSDGKLVAKLRDSNFTREQIDKEYNIAIRRYLRQTDDQKVKKFIDENKEMLLEYFREHLDDAVEETQMRYDSNFNSLRIAAEPEE